ncbi:MAG: DUF4344 domain-containing metallopeptidase [Pseudomonadota bacterium]
MIKAIACAILGSVILASAPFATSAQVEDDRFYSETEEFVAGFVRFVAYHEAGHLIMHQLAGMQTDPYWSKGELEDFADQFAVVLLAPDASDDYGVAEIMDAAIGWLQVDNNAGINDPHSPPQDRALNIVCLVYGSDPMRFSDLQEFVEPDNDCQAQYTEMDDAIEDVFRAQTDEFGVEIEIKYLDANAETAEARDFLIRSEILEDLKDDLESDYILTNRTIIQARNCRGRFKEDTFHFNTVSGEFEEDDRYFITICYEMIDMRLRHGMTGVE